MKYTNTDSLHCISLMSGTSSDGIDGLLIEFSSMEEAPTHRIVQSVHIPFESYYKSLATEVIEKQDLQKAFYLGQCLAQAYANTVSTLLGSAMLDASDISFIAVSGHTLFHKPASQKENGMTIDTTDISMVSALTGISTIGKFRQKDIAYGGHGAPLVPFALPFIFGSVFPNSIIQNVGGIGNLTVLENGQAMIGFDTGPGNTWMDQTIKWHTNGQTEYDEGGTIAKRGTPDQNLVHALLTHPFFTETPPKSTGIKTVGYPFLNQYKQALLKMRLADAMATVTFATAKTIAQAYDTWVFNRYSPTSVVVTGGGAYNKTLCDMLSKQLPYVAFEKCENCHVLPEQVEALSFGYLGLFRWLEKPNVLCNITGSVKNNIGGEIAYAD